MGLQFKLHVVAHVSLPSECRVEPGCQPAWEVLAAMSVLSEEL